MNLALNRCGRVAEVIVVAVVIVSSNVALAKDLATLATVASCAPSLT